MWRWPANGRRIWRVWGCHLFIQMIHSVHVWTGLLLHCANLGKTAWGEGDLVPDQRAEGTGGTAPVRMGRAGEGERRDSQDASLRECFVREQDDQEERVWEEGARPRVGLQVGKAGPT